MSESCEEADSDSRIDRIHAELAAKEREALEVIKEDVCQWLSKVVSELKGISPLNFMERLETGVALCKLVTLIQQSAAAAVESGKNPLNLTVPMDVLNCTAKAERGSFFARDNTANFITWCRELGVDEAVIFESEGLVLHRDEKRVILCLLDVARYAERVGISPPELVRMEREIEQLEANEGEKTLESKDTEKKYEREPKSTEKIPLTPPVVSLDRETTPTESKTPELTVSPDKERHLSITGVTSEQGRSQLDRTEAPVSSRNVLYTPSRIPVPVRGTTRTYHMQAVQPITRQLRKRKREEQEPEEGEGKGEIHKAKKRKRSPPPPPSARVSSKSVDVSSPQETNMKEEMRTEEVAAVEKSHESVDDKVCLQPCVV